MTLFLSFARYVGALRRNLREKIAKRGIQLPPLCCCGETVWDSNPDTCANNCIFYKNPKGTALCQSGGLWLCRFANAINKFKYEHFANVILIGLIRHYCNKSWWTKFNHLVILFMILNWLEWRSIDSNCHGFLCMLTCIRKIADFKWFGGPYTCIMELTAVYSSLLTKSFGPAEYRRLRLCCCIVQYCCFIWIFSHFRICTGITIAPAVMWRHLNKWKYKLP